MTGEQKNQNDDNAQQIELAVRRASSPNDVISCKLESDELDFAIPNRLLADLPDEQVDAIARHELHSLMFLLSRLDRTRESLRRQFLLRHPNYIRRNAHQLISLFHP